ncbi:hypothetical protein BZA77DRAFT_30986 [Pyronema omphalodes]|nr:hypothetical protein BZA77DRAFT_30986 [Pyronema omphalodes]
MSTENSYEHSAYSSTSASCSTPGSETPTASETMSATPTVAADLQTSSPAYETILRSFQDTFTSLKMEMARLEFENKRLETDNKRLETDNKRLETENQRLETKNKRLQVQVDDHQLAYLLADKEVETSHEIIIELSKEKDDAIKKIAEVEEEKVSLQKELDGLGELKEILGWKKRCEELENRVTENQERIDKRIADVQHQSQKNLEQEVNWIKEDHTLKMQSLMNLIGFKDLEDMKDGYVVREKPFKIIPGGMIQVSLAMVKVSSNGVGDGPLSEDPNTSFLYVVQEQYKDFKIFTALAESVFGLKERGLTWLKGRKSYIIYCPGESEEKIQNEWENQASQKDRIYLISAFGADYARDTVYYDED